MSDQNDNINSSQTGPLVVILAGGQARRMGGVDKGEIILAGRRLVDHVVERLLAQTSRIIFSGPQSYGLDYTAIEDRDDGPKGPAAGLWAVLEWVKKNSPHADGFYTVPVDGPFLPLDFLKRLGEHSGCSMAVDSNGAHPTFAYWETELLSQALKQNTSSDGVALRQIAKACGAKQVRFSSDDSLMNINSPNDLLHAENSVKSV